MTAPVYLRQPSGADGYARFEQAALAFGGAGATYNPTTDGSQGGYFVDYGDPESHTGDGERLARIVIADFAGDGTTPPAGTVIRFTTTNPPVVAAEPSGPDGPRAGELEAVWPNPFRDRVHVRYALPVPGRVRLAVYDVLGREVAVLTDRPHAAGAHEATLEAAPLAAGVYLVVLEAEGARATRKVTLLR
jgi:hypothetical protein